MKLTIIPEDMTVIIDGERFGINCQELVDQGVHAVQWSGSTGHIEFKDAADGNKPANQVIGDIERFQPIIDAWHAAKAMRDTPVPPESPSLDEAKVIALAAINRRCALELAAVRVGYPDDEVQSWAKQEAEARAYLADALSPTLFLGALCGARGVPLPLLAAKVIEKADLFAAASGRAIGTRQACEDAIGAAETPDAALAVLWPEPVIEPVPAPMPELPIDPPHDPDPDLGSTQGTAPAPAAPSPTDEPAPSQEPESQPESQFGGVPE